MNSQITFTIFDPDPDYLGLEIYISNELYSGTAEVYADNDELSKFCAELSNFPSKFEDRRSYLFGTRDEGYAGGFCELTFICDSSTGQSTVEVDISSSTSKSKASHAYFKLQILPAELDNFLPKLLRLEAERAGKAQLN